MKFYERVHLQYSFMVLKVFIILNEHIAEHESKEEDEDNPHRNCDRVNVFNHFYWVIVFLLDEYVIRKDQRYFLTVNRTLEKFTEIFFFCFYFLNHYILIFLHWRISRVSFLLKLLALKNIDLNKMVCIWNNSFLDVHLDVNLSHKNEGFYYVFDPVHHFQDCFCVLLFIT